jgi:hypothetical protein
LLPWRYRALTQIIPRCGFTRNSKTDRHGPCRRLVIASANDRLPPFAGVSVSDHGSQDGQTSTVACPRNPSDLHARSNPSAPLAGGFVVSRAEALPRSNGARWCCKKALRPTLRKRSRTVTLLNTSPLPHEPKPPPPNKNRNCLEQPPPGCHHLQENQSRDTDRRTVSASRLLLA